MRQAWLLPLACLLSPPVQARGLSVEDVLANEEYTQVLPAPRAGVVVIGRTRPYKEAGNYRYDWFTRRVLSELWTFSSAEPSRLVRVLGGEVGTGYWAAGLSPSGRRLAVFRLREDRLALGILDLARGSVRWLKTAPDMPYSNPNPSWLDDDHLLLVTRPDGSLPAMLAFGFEPARRAPASWALTAQGLQAAVSVLGSGSMLGKRDRAPARYLTIYDIRTGAVRRLLDGDIVDVLVSPDRRRVAIVREDADLGVDQTRTADPADLTRARRLDIVDLSTGRATPACKRCDVLPNLLAWSPSSGKLIFYARTSNAPWTNGKLLVASGRLGDHPETPFPNFVASLDTASAGAITVHARWMGEQPVLLGSPSVTAASSPPVADWYLRGRDGRGPVASGAGPTARIVGSSAGSLTYLTNGRLLRATFDGPPTELVTDGKVETATAPLDPLLDGARSALNPDPESTLVLVRHAGTSTPIDLARTGDVLHRYQDVMSDVRIVAGLPAQNAVLQLAPLGGSAATLRLRSADRVVTLDAINRNLADVAAVTPVVLKGRGADGAAVSHHLYLPAGGTGAAPLVVMPYPGVVLSAAASTPNVATFNPTTNIQLLVAQGYAVLEPSMPAPTNAPVNERWSPLDRIANQITEAIGDAVATGRIDRTRVAVYGHSYGGYAALAMATHGDVVRCVIASAAPANLAAGYGAIDPRQKTQDAGIFTTAAFGWFESGQGTLGATPWASPERYVKNSPLFRAGAMNAPLLLIHGEFDYVPVAGAEQLFMALYRQNKTAVLLRYAAEGHVIRSPGNIRDEWKRIFAWLGQMDRPAAVSHAGLPSERLSSQTLPIPYPSLDRGIQHQRPGHVAP
ncbi:alpha/beta hydrolase family protein [Sphingomonas faeni]|uniref:alpha/beta hydrolase family protein n=1 Tax=Sphingomonas faeni TaxID=185950 RepID=UPI00277DA010|nr:alpha/beta fold hydrolase [Sphingomonas faeni]MDQ0839260.1 dipeptidyl aminopeptidase/acylaminoacyl peptidase [Sphingomonas faeni]